MKQEIRTPLAPLPSAPYSQGLRVGNRVYVSGQRPVDAATGNVVEGFENQVHQVLTNVRHVLEAADYTMDDVVKVNIYLADLKDFFTMNAIYGEYFNAPYPIRTTVGVALRDILIEIDVIAER